MYRETLEREGRGGVERVNESSNNEEVTISLYTLLVYSIFANCLDIDS